jgi:hypothetical protein
MTPSHPGPPRSRGLFLHLKSGARGLRLLTRSSHKAPPQMGQAGMPSAGSCGAIAFAADALGAAVGATVLAPRGGQITPSHSRSLHLKSGALGFRLPSRLSHIGP